MVWCRTLDVCIPLAVNGVRREDEEDWSGRQSDEAALRFATIRNWMRICLSVCLCLSLQ